MQFEQLSSNLVKNVKINVDTYFCDCLFLILLFLLNLNSNKFQLHNYQLIIVFI